MRLLLINPRFPESWWSSKWVLSEILAGKRAINPPLGLATLAALCPCDWVVEIVDENIEPIPLEPVADIVGVCGMGVQFPRQKELLEYYRARGHFVMAGGSYASLCPEKYDGLADAVVAGESEYIFPAFCKDFAQGAPKPLYHETGTVALTDSPTPRFDLLKLARYSYASLQFSRGCPFRCEFCDIIIMFGRKPRVKSLEQVGRELDELRRFNVRSAFFVDDNLIGNLPVAKKLLQYLRDYQEKHQYWFSFGTEASLNMAQHKDLLELFRAANFSWVFIGIESPDPSSLKETLKTQNLQEDMLTSLRRIYSYGIDVLAGFIIGFDNDTMETFEHQYRFITDAGIQSAMIGLLTALPKTPLYERLLKEGRLSTLEDISETHALRGHGRCLHRAVPAPAHRLQHRRARPQQARVPEHTDLSQRLFHARRPRHLETLAVEGDPARRPEADVVFRAQPAVQHTFPRAHRNLRLDCRPVHAGVRRAQSHAETDRPGGGATARRLRTRRHRRVSRIGQGDAVATPRRGRGCSPVREGATRSALLSARCTGAGAPAEAYVREPHPSARRLARAPARALAGPAAPPCTLWRPHLDHHRRAAARARVRRLFRL
jgi:radical SAM superfamily enzyme YgiQ (UPF0313 family)